MTLTRPFRDSLVAMLVCGFVTQAAGDPLQPSREWDLPDPGMGIRIFAPALDGTLLFVVIKPDTVRTQPLWSSSMSVVSILRSLDPTTGEVTTLDANFVPTEQLVNDPSGATWVLDSKLLSRRWDGEIRPVSGVTAGEGQFRAITPDPDGGVWVGGLGTGLFRVSPDLEVTHYTRENASIPTNSLTAIHIDDARRVWVALWDLKGVLCIDDDTWTVYDSSNSGISRQNVWSIASDRRGDVWIGQGWDDPSRMLVRFDGKTWTPVTVKDADGAVIRGTVRRLTRVGERIWAWVESKARGGDLMVLGDDGWESVAGIGESERVGGISVDDKRNRAWVLTEGRRERRARLLAFDF